jgi:hypothetical protein
MLSDLLQVEKEEAKAVTTDDLFADPNKTIDDVIDSHPVVKKARETTENLERQLPRKTSSLVIQSSRMT